MNKRCIGCGLILQNSNKDEKGYTPNIDKEYCMRCFRLKNYGEKNIDETINMEDIFNKVNKGKGVAFFFVDYLNINNYTINLFKKINLKKVLVVSKIDILRKDMKFNKIKKWLEDVYNINDDILFLSTKTGYGVNSILNYLDNININMAYIMGITNAGKSTFINKLLAQHNINKEILVSDKPNTTLDFIPIHIDNYKIYDTPGLLIPNMNLKLLKKEIKPITFNLKKITTLMFLDYKITFLNPTSVTCYFNISDVKRGYKEIVGEKMKVGSNIDVVIPGVGFINVKEAGELIINNRNIEVRDSISGEEYE